VAYQIRSRLGAGSWILIVPRGIGGVTLALAVHAAKHDCAFAFSRRFPNIDRRVGSISGRTR